jgi:hypothetical protein
MPTLQNSYVGTMPIAVEGMVANSEPRTIITRMVEGAGGIGFGKVAVQGTADNQIKVSVAGGVYRGITVLDPTQVGATPDTYPQCTAGTVMTKGVIWVLASVSVTPGQPAYFVPATGVLTNVTTANTAIPNAIFDSTAGAGALVKLRLG